MSFEHPTPNGDELLPCPLCSRQTTVSRTRFGWETIRCDQCDLTVGATEHDHKDGVITKRWNTRTPTPPAAPSDAEHCKDCCCARSWKALGVTGYTGKSIPEHIEELRALTAPAAKEVEQ